MQRECVFNDYDTGLLSPHRSMASFNISAVVVMLAGLIVLFLMFYKSSFMSPKCHPRPTNPLKLAKEAAKPILLLWFWPEDKKFDLQDCKMLWKIDGCHLTDDRSLYSKAQAVLLFHNAIRDDRSNLPTSPRARFQRWIWFNMDSPNNIRKIGGIEALFNLTLSYRRDADIHVRWTLMIKKNINEDFVLPKKERLLCWIVDSYDLQNKTGDKYSYYRELIKHIEVDVFYSRSNSSLKENYSQTISSCKFYLSFEDSIYRDGITEKFNEPLVAGTVPIALGPPRLDYEYFVPGSSFIHVNDFPGVAKLVEHLQTLDKDNEAYMRYFEWKRFYAVRQHPVEEKHMFAHAICQACHYISMRKEYRAIPDLYKWISQ